MSSRGLEGSTRLPTKFWVQAGVIVGVMAAAFVAIVIMVPREPGGPTTTAAPSSRDNAVPGVSDQTAAPASRVVSAPVAPVDPALAADIAEFVAGRQVGLPTLETRSSWLPVTLVSVEAQGARIAYDYAIDIDGNFYGGPAFPRAIVPGFQVGTCGAFTCFSFTNEFASTFCVDENLTTLLAEGAEARATFSDRNGLQLGRLPVFYRDCPQ